MGQRQTKQIDLSPPDIKIPPVPLIVPDDYEWDERNDEGQSYSAFLDGYVSALAEEYSASCFKEDGNMDSSLLQHLVWTRGTKRMQHSFDSDENTAIEMFIQWVSACLRDEYKRYIIIPLSLQRDESGAGAHSNIMLYDKILRTLEHFDPHGGCCRCRSCKAHDKHLKRSLENIFSVVLDNVTGNSKFEYISPQCLLPSGGPQKEDSYCSVWSMWYLELKLMNQHIDVTSDEIVDKAVKIIRNSEMGSDRYMRAYSFNIAVNIGGRSETGDIRMMDV